MPSENSGKRLRRVVTLGRGANNNVVLSDASVSSQHARILIERGEAYIEDLGSHAGTFVNSRFSPVIGRRKIGPADLILLGNTRISAGKILEKMIPTHKGGGDDEEDAREVLPHEESATVEGRLSLEGRQGILFLGRDASCNFEIKHPMVSLRHARLIISEFGGLYVEDLGSSNGTYVNGIRVKRKTALPPGSRVAFGPVWYSLSEDGIHLIPASRPGEIVLEGRGLGVQVGGGRRILEDVSLAIHPGELVGLMGPSGAGKSTLMYALNGYQPPTSGAVTINGRDLYEQYDEFRGTIGYVPQDDIMHADLTVKEALYFSARMRLPTDFSDKEIYEKIKQVISELGLEGTENTRVGNAERRGVSGGQRKRVNVAMELLTDPPLLFLDEPTSGLSSEDALSLMSLMRKLADSGKTIVLTIHQPSLEVYRLMDMLLVVGKDKASSEPGQLVYSGPAYPDAIEFFGGGKSAEASPDGVLRGLATRPANEWVGRFKNSEHYSRFVAKRLQGRRAHDYKNLSRRKRAGGLSQYASLVRRGFLVKLKDIWNTGVLLVQAPLIALLIGVVFGPTLSEEIGVENYPDVARATATAMFLLGVSALWFGCSNSAREIVAEGAVFRRERMVGLTIPAYVAAKLTVLAVLCVLQCGLLLFIVGWLGSIESSYAFLFVSLLVTAMVGVTIGLLISAAAKTAEVAAGVLPLVILPMVILGGILLPLKDLPRSPVPTHVLAAAMPSRWSFEAVFVEEAKVRPRVVPPDSQHSVPRIVSADSTASASEDMAEKFFEKADREEDGTILAILILATQAVVCIGGVSVLLLGRDTV